MKIRRNGAGFIFGVIRVPKRSHPHPSEDTIRVISRSVSKMATDRFACASTSRLTNAGEVKSALAAFREFRTRLKPHHFFVQAFHMLPYDEFGWILCLIHDNYSIIALHHYIYITIWYDKFLSHPVPMRSNVCHSRGRLGKVYICPQLRGVASGLPWFASSRSKRNQCLGRAADAGLRSAPYGDAKMFPFRWWWCM